MRKKQIREVTTTLADIRDDKFYRVADLKAILRDLGLNYSIFSIMNAEAWKCTNYECAKRYWHKVTKCPECGHPVTEPYIESPRTSGGGRGEGHRRYTGEEIRKIVEAFKEKEHTKRAKV